MAKVKILKRETKFEESDLEYPIYLYFQDDDCRDEYVKVDEKYALIVKSTMYGYIIKTDSNFLIEKNYLKSITEKEYFDEFLDHVLKNINEKR